jgi:lysine 2,3-aminomutase
MKWEGELRRSICKIEQLRRYMNLGSREEKQLRHIISKHPMRITRYYMSLVDWHNPDDPLRRMAVPDIEEMDLSGSYDTSGEMESTKMPGLQHKYAQTALILATNRCSLYCRYCFRKRLVGLPTEEVLQRFGQAARYIEEHREINNVLITGGDPLILPTRVIERFLERLRGIPHLVYVRIGSRLAVTFPERIVADDALLRLLRRFSSRKRRIYVVAQFNHPREITVESRTAVDRLLNAGVVVSNQTVLLRGVNDDPETMATLQSRLVGIGVNPYYVFQCRPVRRVKRGFQIPLSRGYEIIKGAKSMLDGHGKRFRYVMSHRTGKIEIVGVMGDEIYMRYHQARDPQNTGRFFKRRLSLNAGWLDELERVTSQP